jgi:DnaJ-class molecular chaperone
MPRNEEPEDEYWYQCKDCEGTGAISVATDASQRTFVQAECPGCGGSGYFEGEAGAERYGYIRVSANDHNQPYNPGT